MCINFIFRSAYTASKHALQAFFDTLRAEISHHKVKVTVVSPGYIQTNLSLNALTGSGSKYGGKNYTLQIYFMFGSIYFWIVNCLYLHIVMFL